MTAREVLDILCQNGDVQKALNSARFFKTGPGQYGHGDQFLGLTVPQQRLIAKQYKELPLPEVITLLESVWHEARLTALLILVGQFQRSDNLTKHTIYKSYLAHRARVNNWDLVDSSAWQIVGSWLIDKPKTPLEELARSKVLWDRRIAMVATFANTKRGDAEPALHIAEMLINDPEDLMQKAVGWMLREVGKRCDRAILEDFLREHHKTMPRTALRYAIEHFPAERRKQYLAGLS